MSDETAIAKRTIEMGEHGLRLTTLDEAWRFAGAVIASGMAPKGYTKPEAVLIAMQHGAEIGLKPMQALHSIAVINGRATVWGDAIPGLLQSSGLLEDCEETVTGEGDKRVATCRLKRKGMATAFVRTFSVEDAKRAKLWMKVGKEGQPTPWVHYPDRMLAMRARSWAARDGFADVLRGLQVREEVQDYHEPAAAAVVDAKPFSLIEGPAEQTPEPPAEPDPSLGRDDPSYAEFERQAIEAEARAEQLF